MKDGEPTGAVLRRHDIATGAFLASGLRPSEMAGECVMVPVLPDAAEDEGCLLTISYDRDRDGSDLVVLDARASTIPRLRGFNCRGEPPSASMEAGSPDPG